MDVRCFLRLAHHICHEICFHSRGGYVVFVCWNTSSSSLPSVPTAYGTNPTKKKNSKDERIRRESSEMRYASRPKAAADSKQNQNVVARPLFRQSFANGSVQTKRLLPLRFCVFHKRGSPVRCPSSRINDSGTSLGAGSRANV